MDASETEGKYICRASQRSPTPGRYRQVERFLAALTIGQYIAFCLLKRNHLKVEYKRGKSHTPASPLPMTQFKSHGYKEITKWQNDKTVREKCRTHCIFSLAWKESSPLVGSSQKMSDGVPKSWQAIDSRFFSPPEIPRVFSSPTMVSAT